MEKKVVIDGDSITITESLTPKEIIEKFKEVLTDKQVKILLKYSVTPDECFDGKYIFGLDPYEEGGEGDIAVSKGTILPKDKK